MPTTAETPATTPNKTTRSVESPSADKAMITPISMVTPFSRLAARAASPRAGCPEGNIFLSTRLCISQGSQREPPLRVPVTRKATSSSPHACASRTQWGLPEFQSVRDPVPPALIQGSQSEPLRRVRVARKATSSFPHACASYNSAGDCHPQLRKFVTTRRL